MERCPSVSRLTTEGKPGPHKTQYTQYGRAVRPLGPHHSANSGGSCKPVGSHLTQQDSPDGKQRGILPRLCAGHGPVRQREPRAQRVRLVGMDWNGKGTQKVLSHLRWQYA